MSPSSMMPPLTWHTFFTTWNLHIGWSIVSVALLVGYVAGLRAARRRGHNPVGPARIASFVLGVVSLWVCLSSAVDAYAMSLFWMHMIEHLTLIMLVPALLVLGHPLTVLRASGGEGWQERFDRFMYSPPIAILTHPFVGMAVYAVVVFYTHLTPFMDRMAENPHLMVVEQLAYISAGWLMLLALDRRGADPVADAVPAPVGAARSWR